MNRKEFVEKVSELFSEFKIQKDFDDDLPNRYINDDYYGSDLSVIQINNGDRLRIEVVKIDDNQDGVIELNSKLL